MWILLLYGQTYLSQVSKVPERKYGGQEGNLQSGTVSEARCRAVLPLAE